MKWDKQIVGYGGNMRGRLWVPVFPKLSDGPGHCGNTHPPLSESGAGGQAG